MEVCPVLRLCVSRLTLEQALIPWSLRLPRQSSISQPELQFKLNGTTLSNPMDITPATPKIPLTLAI